MKRILPICGGPSSRSPLFVAQGPRAEDAYPSATVRLECWSSAGAPLDVMMRQVGKQLGAKFSARPSSSRTDRAAKAPSPWRMSRISRPTAIQSSRRHQACRLRWRRRTSQFTPDDFIVLPALQAEPSAVAVRADSKFKTMKDFMDFIRAHPDQVLGRRVFLGGFPSVRLLPLAAGRAFQINLGSFRRRSGCSAAAIRRPYRRRHHDPELGPGADQERRYPAAWHQFGGARRIFPRRTDLQGARL